MTARPAVTVAVDGNTAAVTLGICRSTDPRPWPGLIVVVRRVQRTLADFTAHLDLADAGLQARLLHLKKSAASPAGPAPAGPDAGPASPRDLVTGQSLRPQGSPAAAGRGAFEAAAATGQSPDLPGRIRAGNSWNPFMPDSTGGVRHGSMLPVP